MLKSLEMHNARTELGRADCVCKSCGCPKALKCTVQEHNLMELIVRAVGTQEPWNAQSRPPSYDHSIMGTCVCIHLPIMHLRESNILIFLNF